MSAQVTSMLAYKVRKLGSNGADQRQIAEAVRQLLESERDMLVRLNTAAGSSPVRLHNKQVFALPGT